MVIRDTHCVDCLQLRAYIDARAEDHHKLHAVEHSALDAASKAVEIRLDGMNGFRQALNDATKTYVTRETLDAMFSEQSRRLDDAEKAGGAEFIRIKEAMDSSHLRLDAAIGIVGASAQRGAVLSGIGAGILGVIGGAIFIIVITSLTGGI